MGNSLSNYVEHNIKFRQQWVSILLNRGIYNVKEIQQYLEHKLGIQASDSTVRRDITDINDRYENEIIDQLQDAKEKLIAQHTLLYHEAMNAWDKSKKDITDITEEEIYDHEGNLITVKNKKMVKKSNGATNYLVIANSQLERMSKLLGTDSPDKIKWENTLPAGITPDQAIKQLSEIIKKDT